jgi:hypothetical protein
LVDADALASEALAEVDRLSMIYSNCPTEGELTLTTDLPTTLARFVQGGVIPVTTNAVLSEDHRSWSRPEAREIGKLYAHVSPNYAAVVESYLKAQEVAKQSK